MAYTYDRRLRQAVTDILVKEVDFVSGQEPQDDFDPTFAVDVEAVVVISGVMLARLMGKQQRVVSTVLEKMNQKEAISLVSRGGSTINPIITTLKGKISRLLDDYARDQFSRGARVTGIELSDNTDYWEAKINASEQSIQYNIELNVMGKWI
jgi:hypothetical protein